MLVDELLTDLFDGQPHALAAPMAAWLASSRRFAAFVTTFRTKIRKKLRVAQESENLLGLQLELETAYRLLHERSFDLIYEPQPAGQSRKPDFAVSFTTSTRFMLEVTRLQTIQSDPPTQEPYGHNLRMEERLTDMVCSKLGQLSAPCGNVLLVGVANSHLTSDALRSMMLHLQRRAERNDALVVQRHQFRARADFFQHFQRLSELLVRGEQLPASESVVGWVNPQAKYPLPSKVRTALYRSQTV